MLQQWDCHVVGGLLEWGTFDLELGRESNPDWASSIPGRVVDAGFVPAAACNW